MNSIPLYRDFGVAGELTRRPRGVPAPARRGLLRRVVDAIERSRQRAADREMPACGADISVPMTGSPTKWSAACFNISPAIAASGRERRRKLSEETDNDYTDTVAGRRSRAAARASSAFDPRCHCIRTRGRCRRRNCHRTRDTAPP